MRSKRTKGTPQKPLERGTGRASRHTWKVRLSQSSTSPKKSKAGKESHNRFLSQESRLMSLWYRSHELVYKTLFWCVGLSKPATVFCCSRKFLSTKKRRRSDGKSVTFTLKFRTESKLRNTVESRKRSSSRSVFRRRGTTHRERVSTQASSPDR